MCKAQEYRTTVKLNINTRTNKRVALHKAWFWKLFYMKSVYNILCVSLLLAGCVGSAAYYPPPDNALLIQGKPALINPDHYKVNPLDYPVFLAKNDYLPPAPKKHFAGEVYPLIVDEIMAADVWRVTHVINELWIIQSEQFNERECRLLDKRGYSDGFVNIFNRCLRRIDFGIYVDPNGNVNGGWALLPGPQITFIERETYLYYSQIGSKQWAKFQLVPHANIRRKNN